MIEGDLQLADIAPVRIVTHIRIDAPTASVWQALVDNERWPRWFAKAYACRSTGDQMGGVGSTRWIHVDRFRVDERVITWEPERRWAIAITRANLPLARAMIELADIESIPAGRTDLSYTVALEPTWLARPFTSVLRHRLQRVFGEGLAGLEPYLKQRPAAP